MAGGTIASDREGGKPLERLKQRSARQRWRELRGDWQSPPEAPPAEAPSYLPDVRPTTKRTAPQQIPPAPRNQVVERSSPVPAMVAPVPEPIPVEPEVSPAVVTHPGAKPPVDMNEPFHHPGSFADTPSELRVSTPRERHEITLPNWPFLDDLDLVIQQPFEEASDVVEATRLTSSTVPVSDSSPLLSQQSEDTDSVTSPPIQVAEIPSDQSATLNTALTSDEELPVSPEPEPVADEVPLQPEKDPIARLTPIRDIRPFFDYSRSGQSPDEYLCPSPQGADPAKSIGACPIESELAPQGSLDRNHSIIPVYWAASNVYHNPLYFEDPGLERSGHSFSDVVQPFVSLGRFGAQVVALPYTVALDPMWKCETPLGHFRPGECAPKRHLALPLNREAAATAAAAYTGIIYLIP